MGNKCEKFRVISSKKIGNFTHDEEYDVFVHNDINRKDLIAALTAVINKLKPDSEPITITIEGI